MAKKILVTGGAGYIGSHVTLEVLRAGYDVVVVDNLARSSDRSLEQVRRLSDHHVNFVKLDIRNEEGVRNLFDANDFFAVIHLAGFKSVRESFVDPVGYYDNNVSGTMSLLKSMALSDCENFIFSSSASVYGYPDSNPIVEGAVLKPINPYGNTKLIAEMMLDDICQNKVGLNACSLRYFNPLGATESGLLGDNPQGSPENLMPYLTQVAVGKREELLVFGDNYDTPDGTGVRDYIHVVDLAKGHVKALEFLDNGGGVSSHVKINLGTGTGYSVLDVIEKFQEVTGVEVPYRVVEPRDGDAAVSFADPSLAKDLLGWEAELGLADMCKSQWKWETQPRGLY